MFKDFKEELRRNFKLLSVSPLFYVTIDRDEIFEQYLDGFEEEVRQGHNCNTCKSFLRQFAGIVTVQNNKVISIWDDLNVDDEYAQSVRNLSNYIHSLPITDIFTTEDNIGGKPQNFDEKKGVTWSHLWLDFPNNVVKFNVDGVKGKARDMRALFERTLKEISLDVIETVLELITENAIYRGAEFKSKVTDLRDIARAYSDTPEEERHLFTWEHYPSTSIGVTTIRNSAIGTLLVNLSEGMELNKAVSKYEGVVAPQNYQRKTALATPRQIEAASEKLKELGLLSALNRRQATFTDISIENQLYVDRSTLLTDPFKDLIKEQKPKLPSLDKISAISLSNFIKDVLPVADEISILLENKHLNRFVTVVTSDAPKSLFKWNNNFSLSYTNGVADAIKDRVKAAGGKTDGVLRASLSWYNKDDLDISIKEPRGNRIDYHSKGVRHKSSGMLDVDMHANGRDFSDHPVENIIYTNKSKMLTGNYSIMVHNYRKREHTKEGFVVQIETNGGMLEIPYNKALRSNQTVVVADVNLNSEGFKITNRLDTNNSMTKVDKDMWGLRTNRFVRVKSIMISPNYWSSEKTGNLHHVFILEGCKTDERIIPFFNEYLHEDLHEHKKTFEMLSSKYKVQRHEEELSGLGISSTMPTELIVKVKGKYERIMRLDL